jgi:1-phosphatidylinositol-3-phosphate 5-kinase
MSQTDTALVTAHNRLPHFVFTYTLGDRLKITCTVHFAEAFDSLRRRCAIEKAMIDSLSQVENWDASGGKSKAAFFMTKDKRFIVKELVAGWIGSDT